MDKKWLIEKADYEIAFHGFRPVPSMTGEEISNKLAEEDFYEIKAFESKDQAKEFLEKESKNLRVWEEKGIAGMLLRGNVVRMRAIILDEFGEEDYYAEDHDVECVAGEEWECKDYIAREN